MRTINLIVIHCSATPNGRWQTVADIDSWHRARGFKRTDAARKLQNPTLTSIGYHFAIYTNGAIASGRGMDEVGAHVQGYNQKSIGVCMIGTDKFSPAQWAALKANVSALLKQFPQSAVKGHRDLPNVHKTCPGFDVTAWLERGMAPDSAHVLEGA